MWSCLKRVVFFCSVMFPLVWSFQFQVTPGFTSGHVNAVSKTISANAQKFMKDAEDALDAEPASDRKALPVEGPGVVLGLDHLLQLEVEKNQVAEKATSISKTVLDRDAVGAEKLVSTL